MRGRRIKKILSTVLGFLYLIIGGVFLLIPILPTSPFVLLAVLSFSHNVKINRWLRENRIFGKYVEKVFTSKEIGIGLKIVTLSLLWIGFILTMILIRAIWVYITFGTIGIWVTIQIIIYKPNDVN